jgi:hypothetical protein
MQNPPPRWRIVNPAGVARELRSFASLKDFCDEERLTAAKNAPKRITAVDNAMTTA